MPGRPGRTEGHKEGERRRCSRGQANQSGTEGLSRSQVEGHQGRAR